MKRWPKLAGLPVKLRSTLALALLVAAGCAGQTAGTSGDWLMIVPPLDANGDADTSQPLAKWLSVGNFTHQVDCTTMLASQQQGIHAQLGPITRAQTPFQATAVRLLNGQCILKDKIQGAP